jgi:hypothetical protein
MHLKSITMLVGKGHSVLAIGGKCSGNTKAIPLKNIDTITLYLNFAPT